jgi:hypothetical protein
MRGMTGPEARELRLEVNRRMRQRANSDEPGDVMIN